MARITSYDLKTTHFDFRRAKIRGSQNGKVWYIENKYDVYCILKYIDFDKYLFAYEIYSYPELKQMLLDELKRAKYSNINIITNEED